MSLTATEASQQAAEWLTVQDAAMACHVSERTVRRWVSESVVESRVTRSGQRDSRLILRSSLPPLSEDDPPCQGTSGADGVPWGDTTGQGVDDPGIKEPGQGLSESAIGDVSARAGIGEAPFLLLRAEAAEQRAALLENHVATLTAQLEARTDAERELRLLLHETHRALSLLAERPALPTPLNDVAPPRRVRWWWPFKRAV